MSINEFIEIPTEQKEWAKSTIRKLFPGLRRFQQLQADGTRKPVYWSNDANERTPVALLAWCMSRGVADEVAAFLIALWLWESGGTFNKVPIGRPDSTAWGIDQANNDWVRGKAFGFVAEGITQAKNLDPGQQMYLAWPLLAVYSYARVNGASPRDAARIAYVFHETPSKKFSLLNEPTARNESLGGPRMAFFDKVFASIGATAASVRLQNDVDGDDVDYSINKDFLKGGRGNFGDLRSNNGKGEAYRHKGEDVFFGKNFPQGGALVAPCSMVAVDLAAHVYGPSNPRHKMDYGWSVTYLIAPKTEVVLRHTEPLKGLGSFGFNLTPTKGERICASYSKPRFPGGSAGHVHVELKKNGLIQDPRPYLGPFFAGKPYTFAEATFDALSWAALSWQTLGLSALFNSAVELADWAAGMSKQGFTADESAKLALRTLKLRVR